MKVCFQKLNLLMLPVLANNSVTEDTDLYDGEFQSGFVLVYNKAALGAINHIDINLARFDSAGGVLLSLLAFTANCGFTCPLSL